MTFLLFFYELEVWEMDKMQQQKMLTAGVTEMIKEGKDGESLRASAESNPNIRNLLIDIGILATKSYDSEWLESQKSWLEAYQRGNWFPTY